MLKIKNLVKSYGGILATDNLSFNVEAGELHALIGPNGAGKTTLIGQISGEIKQDSGSIFFDDKEISNLPAHSRSAHGLARSFQITNIFKDMTVLENVALAVQSQSGHSFCFWKNARIDPDLRKPALNFLKQIGLEKRADIISGQLSHGEHRQLEIAMALATNPKILLLDEPMAGIGAEESKRIVGILKKLKKKLTILLVEHDMDVVFTLADKITVLVYGKVVATDLPEVIKNNAEIQAAYLG
tara:strand:- start:6889 stop:7617 length:729 start_codon:yes stop_codon:yes gene_type:complete